MEHDDGFSFGIGAFETMLVHDGRCVLLERHLERLDSALRMLGIDRRVDERTVDSMTSDGRLDDKILKIEVSEKNTVFSQRDNRYTDADYDRGFRLRTTDVRRNETSPFTYIKSLMYGDNLMERHKAMDHGYDEALFLNTRGEVCECSSSNIFFISEGELVTPPVSCGMLPGTVRAFIIETIGAEERIIHPADIPGFDGCFLTNSIMGIMPVTSIDECMFRDTGSWKRVARIYASGTGLSD